MPWEKNGTPNTLKIAGDVLSVDDLTASENNQYLFQTKAPINYGDWTFYDNQILCITLETNRQITSSVAPPPSRRIKDFFKIPHPHKAITIEPIMDFDLYEIVEMINYISPKIVNIGADSGHNNLPEPSKEKVLQLINE